MTTATASDQALATATRDLFWARRHRRAAELKAGIAGMSEEGRASVERDLFRARDELVTLTALTPLALTAIAKAGRQVAYFATKLRAADELPALVEAEREATVALERARS